MSSEDIRGKDGKKSRMDPKARPAIIRAVEMPPVVYGVPPKQVPARTLRSRKPPGPKPSKKS